MRESSLATTVISPRRALHRTLRSLGLQVSRWRDPYRDLARLLGKQQVLDVVDGGAHYGGAARRLLEVFPAATVHAFEPQAGPYQRLEAEFANEPRVRLYRLALGAAPGEATLFVTATDYTSSLLPGSDDRELPPAGQERVSVTSLDALWPTTGRSIPRVIKLDLQGYELDALRGSAALLGNGVAGLLVEVNFRTRYVGQASFHELVAFLAGFGLRLFRLYEIIPDPDDSWRQADALFVQEAALPHAPRR